MQIFPFDEEYQKNKDLKVENVKSLLNWIELQPNLPKMSELEAILFLHSCYYNVELAKSTIDTYSTCRTRYCPEFFDNRDPTLAQTQEDMDVMIYQYLPELTPEGYKVMYIKILDSDSSNFNCKNQVRIFTMAMDLLQLQQGTAEGHIILMDLSTLQISHLTKLNIFVLKKFFYYLQEAIPFRLKGLYFFEAVSFIDKLLMLLRPFLKKEVLDTMHIYTKEKITDLYKYIPKVCLPEDYGGDAPSIKALHEKMKQNIIENREWFLSNEQSQKDEETLRPDTPKNSYWSSFWRS